MKIKMIKMGMDIDETRNHRIRGIVPTSDGKYLFIEIMQGSRPDRKYTSCSPKEYEKKYPNPEYIFLDSKNVKLKNVEFQGKYSFQYMENLEIENCKLDTKDAFWHSKNVIVKDSIVKGEYLAWFSDGLTLINCKIIGTQPLCYCKNLKLINCTMEDTDLAFEYSEVEADIKGNVVPIKNPKSGNIIVDSVGEIINEDSIMEVNGKVIIRKDS